MSNGMCSRIIWVSLAAYMVQAFFLSLLLPVSLTHTLYLLFRAAGHVCLRTQYSDFPSV